MSTNTRFQVICDLDADEYELQQQLAKGNPGRAPAPARDDQRARPTPVQRTPHGPDRRRRRRRLRRDSGRADQRRPGRGRAETFGNPGQYAAPMFAFVGVAVYALLGGAWFFVSAYRLILLTPTVIKDAAILAKAVFQRLLAAAGFLLQLIKAAGNRIKSLFP